MRFVGAIQRFSIKILPVNESDDNFIQSLLAKFLHLNVVYAPSFKVLVGNWHTLQIESLLKQLHVQVQYYSLILRITYYPQQVLTSYQKQGGWLCQVHTWWIIVLALSNSITMVSLLILRDPTQSSHTLPQFTNCNICTLLEKFMHVIHWL